MATQSPPGAPAAPQVLQYADSIVRIYWAQPVPLGGGVSGGGTLAESTLSGYRVTATWSSSVQAEVCATVLSWVGGSATSVGITAQTDTNGLTYYYYNVDAIPGKSYAFTVLATNIITPTGGVPTTQLGGASSSVSQAANSIVRPYPLPTIAANTVGSGYVTFTITSVGNYAHIGTSVAYSGAGFPNSYNQNGWVGYQILQMSPNTDQTGPTFVADRTWDFTSWGSFGAGAVTTNLYPDELLANSKYRFKALASNGFQSAISAADITVTTNAAAVVPGAVNTVQSSYVAKRSNSISLTWLSPLETGGRGALTQFKVTYTAASSTNIQTNTTAPAIGYNAFGHPRLPDGVGRSFGCHVVHHSGLRYQLGRHLDCYVVVRCDHRHHQWPQQCCADWSGAVHSGLDHRHGQQQHPHSDSVLDGLGCRLDCHHQRSAVGSPADDC
jgi:hypothetical protein